MSPNLESILEEINKLPSHEQRQLARKLNERKRLTLAERETARALVKELASTAQGFDKKTIIHFAEDEEYCGY